MAAGDTTPGRRFWPAAGAPPLDAHTADQLLAPGDYCRCGTTLWFKLPLEAIDGPFRLEHHTLTEHEDGTLTVSPSILSRWGDDTVHWHGYLERGVWREV